MFVICHEGRSPVYELHILIVLLSFQYVYFLLVFICMYILCNIIYSFILNHGRYAKIGQRSSALGDTTDLNYI